MPLNIPKDISVIPANILKIPAVGDPLSAYAANAVLVMTFDKDTTTAYVNTNGFTINAIGTPNVDTTNKVDGAGSLHTSKPGGTSGDIVRLVNGNAYGYGAVTTEAWVRVTDPDATYILLWDGLGSYRGYILRSNNANYYLNVAVPAEQAFPTDGTWVHVCHERDEDGVTRVYINGRQQFQVNHLTPSTPVNGAGNTDINLLNYNTGAYDQDANMDTLRISYRGVYRGKDFTPDLATNNPVLTPDINHINVVDNETIGSSAIYAYFTLCAPLGNDRALMVWRPTAGSCAATVVTRSGDTISADTPTDFTTETTQYGCDICDIDDNKILHVNWNATGPYYLRASVISVNASTDAITFNTAVSLTSHTVQGCVRVAKLATDKAVVVYEDNTTQNVYVAVISVSGTTPSMGTPLQVAGKTASTYFGIAAAPGGDQFVLIAEDGTTDGYVQCFTVSGTTITSASAAEPADASEGATYPNIYTGSDAACMPTSGKVLFAFGNASDGAFLNMSFGTVSSSGITWDSDPRRRCLSRGNNGTLGELLAMNNNEMLYFYQSTGIKAQVISHQTGKTELDFYAINGCTAAAGANNANEMKACKISDGYALVAHGKTGTYRVQCDLVKCGSIDTDVLTGGTASASSTYSTYSADKAVDGNQDTGWWAGATTGWWKYDLGAGNSATFCRVKIQGNTTATYPASDAGPAAFDIEGSNNDSDWTTLRGITGQSWAQNQTRTYDFSNGTAYRYLRINITGAESGSQYPAIIRIMAYEVDIS